MMTLRATRKAHSKSTKIVFTYMRMSRKAKAVKYRRRYNCSLRPNYKRICMNLVDLAGVDQQARR